MESGSGATVHKTMSTPKAWGLMPPGARVSLDEDAAPAPLPTVSLSGFYERGFPMTRDGAGGQKFGRVREGTSREKFFNSWNAVSIFSPPNSLVSIKC